MGLAHGTEIWATNGVFRQGSGGMYGTFEGRVIGKEATVSTGNLMKALTDLNGFPQNRPQTDA